jgi:hypothetical protein
VIVENPVGKVSEFNGSAPKAFAQAITYFILTVLGFSFWFLMVVPFASHRESYSWLAAFQTETFAQQFSFGLSSTYRPLARIVTRLGFLILGPGVFPTSVLRQALLQLLIYAMFVLAWWLIYSVAPQRRVFAFVAFIVGGVFFSGYVQLFHIYGMFYVPVLLTLGALLHSYALGTFHKREVGFAIITILLAFWHPFATALFVGFFFGFYLDSFWKRGKTQHIQAVAILLVGLMAIFSLVVLFPRAHMPSESRLLGFLASYQTNEVNRIASFVALLLTQVVIFSMRLSPRVRFAASFLAATLCVVVFLKSLPVLLIWFLAILVKLFRLRCWSLFFAMLTAALLPFGGGIGSPVYGLFAIVIGVYVTPLGWLGAERKLSFLEPRYIMGIIAASVVVVLLVRVGIEVPIVTAAAKPLLAERERTYQLESILSWLHRSDYCGYEISFADNAGSPIENVEDAISRRQRPPAGVEDVRFFWNAKLRCRRDEYLDDNLDTAKVTFGGQAVAGSIPVFEVKGRYAGDATVWIENRAK